MHWRIKDAEINDSKKTLINAAGRRRIIRRTGVSNLVFLNLANRGSRYLQDIYTTLVDLNWRCMLFIFFMTFILCWLTFAFVWFMVMKVHGDDLNQDETHIPCLHNVQTFTAAFLFSLETQHTIGYGSRYPTEACSEAVIIVAIQSIIGVILQAFMVGVVFAKLTRPNKRTNTLLFSRVATVCLRNGQLCLLFRVADMRKSSILGASVTAHVIRRQETAEGEVIPFHQSEIVVKSEGGSDNLLFLWPVTIIHVIDSESPFYFLSATDLMNEDFELVIFLEGVAESTGTSMQARYSYVPSNIHWGHRFYNLVSYSPETENYIVDFSLFNSTIEIPTPLCSARDLEDYKEKNDRLLCYSSANSDRVFCIEPDSIKNDALKEGANNTIHVES